MSCLSGEEDQDLGIISIFPQRNINLNFLLLRWHLLTFQEILILASQLVLFVKERAHLLHSNEGFF